MYSLAFHPVQLDYSNLDLVVLVQIGADNMPVVLPAMTKLIHQIRLPVYKHTFVYLESVQK